MSLRAYVPALLLAACTTPAAAPDAAAAFSYGGGHPGRDLPEGGGALLEHALLLGMPAQTWVDIYQYTGVTLISPFAFDAPKDGPFGDCVDLRTDPKRWPFDHITGATLVAFATAKLSGPGITGAVDLAALNALRTTVPPSPLFSSSSSGTFGVSHQPLDADGSQPGGEYTIDIGKGAPMALDMPETFTPPEGIGSVMSVDIDGTTDLHLDWTPPPNDFGVDGISHTARTHFYVTVFVDPNNSMNPPQFGCFASFADEGHQIIPQAVLAALPAGGLIVSADMTHVMEARQAVPGELRRFDLVGMVIHISLYNKR